METLKQSPHGYIYDRRIFWVAMILIILVGVFIMGGYGFDFSPRFYFKCEYPGPCKNPLIDARCNVLFKSGSCADLCKEEWCKQEFLLVGEYGTKRPDGLIKFYLFIVMLIMAVSLFANHYFHNKGKKFEIMIPISEGWKQRMKKFWGELEDEEETDQDNC